MKKEEAFAQDSQSEINSSTSSYSEILPRQDNFIQVRRDNPIIMRSIPANRQKPSFHISQNLNEQKNISSTMILSSHTNTNLSHSNISAEVYKMQSTNENLSRSTKSIKIEQKQQENEVLLNQKLVKSTYESHRTVQQRAESVSITQKKEQSASKQDFQNVALDFSMSSFSSEKQPIIQQKQPFKTYFDSTPKKSESEYNEQQVKQYLEAIKDMRREQQQKYSPSKSDSTRFQTLIKKNQQLEIRIRQLEDLIKNESESKIIERKANQVYTEFYHNLSKMITKFIDANKDVFSFSHNQMNESLNQSVNMEKILLAVEKLIETFSIKPAYQPQISASSTQTDPLIIPKKQHQSVSDFSAKIKQLQYLLQSADQKNTQLKNELLQSTQNNINSIFNSEISASCCLQNQVTKINSEMNFLKEKINLLLLRENHTIVTPPAPLPPQIIYLSQPSQPLNPFNERKQNKIIKIYTSKSKIHQSDEESDSVEGLQKRKRQHSLSRKRKKSSKSQRSMSSSSMSSRSTKKRQEMSRKQIQNLKQAYSQTKNELNSLIQTFSLITNSQNEMKGYFSKIKEQIILSLNDKLKQGEQARTKRELQRTNQLQNLEHLHAQQHHHHSTLLTEQLTQQIRQNQQSYLTQIDYIKKQRQEDRRVIEGLNEKMKELINAISVPERVSQENRGHRADGLNDDQIPVSFVSVSVENLRMIQRLKAEREKQGVELQVLMKENSFLKQQILNLKNLQQRSRINQTKEPSIHSSRQINNSIINQLNGFTEMSLPPPLMLNTNENYKSSKQVTFNNNTKSKQVISMQKIESEKMFRVDSHKNFQNNFKVVLQTKQNHIRHLEQAITNLEETIDYLKGEITSKEQVIEELQGYVSNLENRSVNSITLSSPGSNVPQTNLYLDPGNLSESIKYKYQNYVKNLKILLKQTRNQNKILKDQLLNFQAQADQLTQSNFNLKNSATHSERTTKNFPNSSSPTHANSKGHRQVVIRKRTQNTQKYESQRQQQRINSLAFDNDLPQQIQILRSKGKIPI